MMYNCKTRTLDIDVSPIRIKFYAARNSVIAKSRGVNELVKVPLLESYCTLYLRLLAIRTSLTE